MEQPVRIADDVYWIGRNDRETDLFESIWPLPRGVSLNAYLIRDERVAVIDAVKQGGAREFVERIRQVIGAEGKVDYLIVNHMEPDHSGAIRTLVEQFPELRIVGTKRTAGLLESFYGITDRLQVVADGDTLELGKRTLRFFATPMIHWPETMMTYVPSDQVLFSGDAFGSFGALEGGIFDNEVDIASYDEEIIRYFANIVGKYSAMVRKALLKLADVPIRVVASTHGPIWRANPKRILDLYGQYSRHEAEAGAVLAYGSMYGNTERLVEAVAAGLREGGVSVIQVYDASRTHVSYILRDAWRYKGVLLASPTYDAHLLPPMDGLVRLLESKMLRDRVLGLVGSCGWSGEGMKELKAFAERAKWDLVEPVVLVKGAGTRDDAEQCKALGRGMAKAIQATE